MTIITSILTAGTNNHQTTSEEANRFTTNFVTPGIVGSLGNTSGVAPMTGGFALSATGTNKIVSIATGDAVITATPSGQASQNLNVRSDSVVTKTIADNTSGGTRYDWIYLAVDATKANNPAVNADDVTTVVVNRSTSNVTDTSGAIPAYRQLLGIVTVANGFTTISNANIADSRTAAGAAVPDGSITTAKLADGAVTNAKVASGISTAKLFIPYKFSVTQAAAVNATTAFTLIPFDTEEFDTGNNVSAGVFTVPVAGYYQFNWQAQLDTAPSSLQFLTSLFKNGVRHRDGNTETVNGAAGSVGAAFLSLTAGDTITIRAYCASTKAIGGVGTAGPTPVFTGYLVSTT